MSPGSSATSIALRSRGGRTWWAHLDFSRINIGPIILKNQIEELMHMQGIGEQSFLKLKALVMIAPAKTAER
jgi:hypothetical protein